MHQSQQNYNIHRKRADIKMSCIHKSKCKHFCIELEQSTSLNSIFSSRNNTPENRSDGFLYANPISTHIYTFIKNLQKSTMQ